MSLDLAKNYELDVIKASNGVWHEHAGARFLLGYFGLGNTRFQHQLNKLLRSGKEPEDMDYEEFMEYQNREIDAFVQCVLLGWENVSINDKPAEYSKEVAARVLKAYPLLYAEIKILASKQAKYASEQEGEDVKNSEAS